MGNFTGKTWRPECIEALKRLWASGATAAVITDQMNRTHGGGFSRNGIIGKAHRLGLTKRPSPTRHEPGKKKARRDDYSPSALKAAAARQDAAFSARLTSAQQAKQAAATGGRSLSARVAGSVTSAAKRAKAAAGTATRNAQQRNAIMFGEKAEKPRAVAANPFAAEPIAPKPTEKDDGRRGVPFAGLSGRGCKWAVTPDNVRADQHRFCNAPSAPEQPYCPQHCEAARGKPAQSLGGLAA